MVLSLRGSSIPLEEPLTPEEKLPVFDGIEGYWWTICAGKFWDDRGTPEAQRLVEVEKCFTGQALNWFRLWRRRNPTAEWMTFEIAFLHRYQSNFQHVLPEIFQNEVSDLDLALEEIKECKRIFQQQLDLPDLQRQQQREEENQESQMLVSDPEIAEQQINKKITNQESDLQGKSTAAAKVEYAEEAEALYSLSSKRHHRGGEQERSFEVDGVGDRKPDHKKAEATITFCLAGDELKRIDDDSRLQKLAEAEPKVVMLGVLTGKAKMASQVEANDGAFDGEAPPSCGEAPQVHGGWQGSWLAEVGGAARNLAAQAAAEDGASRCVEGQRGGETPSLLRRWWFNEGASVTLDEGTFVAGQSATVAALPWVFQRSFWSGKGAGARLDGQELGSPFLGLAQCNQRGAKVRVIGWQAQEKHSLNSTSQNQLFFQRKRGSFTLMGQAQSNGRLAATILVFLKGPDNIFVISIRQWDPGGNYLYIIAYLVVL